MNLHYRASSHRAWPLAVHAALGLGAAFTGWQTSLAYELQPVANANSEPFPITISADPPATPAGQAMTLNGSTLPLLNADVVVSITAPKASPPQAVKLPAPRCADGRFSVNYVPPVAGTYLVDVIAPDGRGHASTTFTAEDPQKPSRDGTEAVAHLAQDVSLLVPAIRQKVAELPASPAREMATKKLDALTEAMKPFVASSKEMADAIAWALEVTSDMPAAGTSNLSAAPGRAELCASPMPADHKVDDSAAPGKAPAGNSTTSIGQTTQVSRPPAQRSTPPKEQPDETPDPSPWNIPRDRAKVPPALAKVPEYDRRTKEELAQLKQDTVICDNLEKVVEGIKWVGFMINFLSKAKGVAFNFVQDLAATKANSWVTNHSNDLGGFYSASLIKYFDTFSKKNLSTVAQGKLTTEKKWTVDASNIMGLANDVAGYMAGGLMAAYCKQFSGPVTAHMHATFNDETNGRKWWEYSFDVRGQITLHYPREASKGPVPLKGRIEGFALNYKLWENALSVKFPELMSSAVQRRIYWLPWSAADEQAGTWQEIYSTEGSIAGKVVIPSSFFFEVKGTATDDRLDIQIGPQHLDTDAKANVLALFVTVLPMSINYTVYSLPYKPVHFIFEKAAPSFSIPLVTEKAVIRGKQHFENKKGASEAMGEYKVDIEACNPGCQ